MGTTIGVDGKVLTFSLPESCRLLDERIEDVDERKHDPRLPEQRKQYKMKKKALFATLSAGAIAGTGAGLILGVPGLTSAAGDSSDDASTGSMVETIDGESHHGRRGGHGRMASAETLSEVLGIDAEALRSEFAAGKSIADIAQEQGIEIETVVDALVAEVETHLSEHVADGSLTEDEAAEKLADAEAKISDKVNEVQMVDGRGPRSGPRGALSETVLEMLGVDAETLKEAFAAGQSVADVAAENGVDLNDIVSALVDEKAAHLAEHVADGSLSQEEADERIADAEAKITDRLTTVPPARSEGPHRPMGGDRGHAVHVDIAGSNIGPMDDGAATGGTGFDNLLNSDA